MNGTNEPVNVSNIKKEAVDTSETNQDDKLKPFRHHLIGPFAVNESSYQEDTDKYPLGESSQMSDSDVLSIRIASRDGADSVTSHESDKLGYADDVGGELKYECQVCSAKFRSSRAFMGHTNAHRYSSEGQSATFLPCSPFPGQFSPKPDQTNGTFKCDGCQKIFYSRDTYAMHMMLRAKNENCSLAKSALSQLNCDLKEEKNERVKMNIEAILSSIGHSTWSTMDIHKMTMRKAFEYRSPTHNISDVLACTVCGEVMHSKDSLAMHMLFHARSDDTEENQQSHLHIPPLALPTMREYVNALAIAGNKVQTARHIAAFQQAAVNMSTSSVTNVETRTSQTSSKQDYKSLALSKRTEWEENESRKICSRVTDETNQSHESGNVSPITPPSTNHILTNGFQNSANGTLAGDVEETKSETAVEFVKQEMHLAMDLTCTKNEAKRPKSLDCCSKGTNLSDKKYHGKYKSYQRLKMRSLIRKYSKQNLQKRQHQQQNKLIEMAQIPTADMPPLIETNPKIPKDILAAHSITCYCQYCEIIYLDKTIYQLHMGLHNVNNPWQCNACGKICVNRLEFSSHVLHY